MPQDPKAIFEAYNPLYANYERLALEVATKLTGLIQRAGVRPQITHRAKGVSSLIKKCLLYDGPMDKVGDKAGVKVVVRYSAEVEIVNSLIARSFTQIGQPDEKIAHYRPNELGYLGTHHQVTMLPGDCLEELAGLECEIIVHTGAQSLWDSITHELMYKPLIQLPESSQRLLHLLLAQVEMFDREVNSVRSEYIQSPSYRESRMLDILQKHFVQFDPREHRRDMSMRTLEALAPVIGEDKINNLDDEISQFIQANFGTLNRIYEQFQDPADMRGLFLHQPETLLIFAMFSWNQRYDVKKAWLSLYPRNYLEELGSMWGVVIPR